MTLLDLKDLETHLWEAAHIITGPIDASDYKTYIFPILFFKRICDVYDEELEKAIKETGGDAEMAKAPMFHRIDIPDGCHWDDVIAKTQDVGHHLKEAFNKIEQANDNLYGIFGDELASFGTGLFNNAYEIYVPLFTLATAGFPIAVSRLISESNADFNPDCPALSENITRST